VVPFLLVSAVVPSMLLIWFFHSRDVYPEPQRVVWATFGLGVAIVIPVVIVELIISAMIKHVENPFLNGTLEGFFCAGFTEELFKYGVVTLFCMRHKEFDEPMDGIVYGAVASLGFATLENILYVSQGGGGSAIMRALSAVPCHASMGAVMGYFVGQAKFRPRERTKLMALGFFIPMMLHGAYDAPLLTAAKLSEDKVAAKASAGLAGLFLLVTLVTLIGEITWAIILSGRLRREQQVWHSARWAAWYAGQPPPPPPWFAGFVSAPVWTYAPSHFPQQQGGQGYPQQQQRMPQAQAQGGDAGATLLSWMMLLFGGLVATFGGLMALGSVLAAASPHPTESGAEAPGPVMFLIVGLVLGVVPLVLGVGLFFFGIKRLVAETPKPPPRAYPVYGT